MQHLVACCRILDATTFVTLDATGKQKTLKKQQLTNRRKRSILGKGVAQRNALLGVGAKPDQSTAIAGVYWLIPLQASLIRYKPRQP